MQHFGHVTILVDDFEEALDFYGGRLGFEVRTDVEFGEGQRWLTVAPSSDSQLEIVFVLADKPELRTRVGSQVADHVLLTVFTHDIDHEFERLKNAGVKFHGEPRNVPWGKEVVFEDLYGNRFDLVQPSAPPTAG